MIDIILVKYDQPDYEGETIEQVLKCTDDRKTPYHLTVYDNYEKDENLSTVWNRLIRRSDAPFICLLNTDTVVQKGWLERLLGTFQEYDKVGAVGPISNRAAGIQGGHKEALDSKPVEVTSLSGFCLLFPKLVWERVGGFNEAYHLYGEDSQFTYDIKQAGLRMFVRMDTFVYHHKAKSSESAIKRGKDITKIQKEANQIFQNYVETKSRLRR